MNQVYSNADSKYLDQNGMFMLVLANDQGAVVGPPNPKLVLFDEVDVNQDARVLSEYIVDNYGVPGQIRILQSGVYNITVTLGVVPDAVPFGLYAELRVNSTSVTNGAKLARTHYEVGAAPDFTTSNKITNLSYTGYFDQYDIIGCYVQSFLSNVTVKRDYSNLFITKIN